MIEVEITTTPQSLRTALGIAARAGYPSVWIGRAQNRGPATVYRLASATAPDPAAVRGFRHAVADTWAQRVRSNAPDTWVWTAAGTATLLLEPGDFAG